MAFEDLGAERSGPTWSNWWGGHGCRPARLERVTTEAEVLVALERAAAQQLTLRVAGNGHSFSPLVITDGVILDVRLRGEVDVSDSQLTVPAGLRLHDVFDPLWSAGYALRNMGELDSVTVTGAVSTGVHGTGIALPSMSASVRSMRLATARGEVIEVSSTDEELFRAARLALGMLGVITELTLDVVPAYDLVEDSFFMSPREALDRWDELLHRHRHFSFYYLPSAQAFATYSLLPTPPVGTEEICYATVRDAVEPGQSSTGPGTFQRRDRMNRILTYEYESRYREIEFAVPMEEGKLVFERVRACLLERYPGYAHPVDVRFVARDDALLSWCHDAPKVIFSVPESVDTPYDGVLADMERLFYEHGGLPHWGKEHRLDVQRLQRLQSGFEPFREIRRELDPNGMFLNAHLSPLFA